jgi:hypothetical protein
VTPHGRRALEVRLRVKRPYLFCSMEPTPVDREGFDDEPRVALGTDPRFRVEALSEIGGVGVDTMQGPAH